jgi:hypothetical protein
MFLALFVLSPLTLVDWDEPNTLTKREIQEGWILLFDGKTTYGWKVDGDAKVENGSLLVGGHNASTIESTSQFGAYELRFDFRSENAIDLKHSALRTILPRPNDAFGWVKSKIRVDEGKLPGPPKAPGAENPQRGMTISTQVEMKTGFFSAAMMATTPSTCPTLTTIRIESPAGNIARIRSIKLRPLATKPLLNGNDLTGWKVFVQNPKQNKSQWTVTKDCWLSLKNGPGDLQTEKKFDDFILQLECISNGKALNSGVFFRCVENEYQNGYEAQIHNGFKDNDRTKPSDFGTGAIYRRMPARKVVPNDNEWFTMTVLAQGKHIATWVNGYQTVDWTDDRKPDNNPRNGSKTAAGHISIQGHDPTTDLSFRNIRIAELKGDVKKD